MLLFFSDIQESIAISCGSRNIGILVKGIFGLGFCDMLHHLSNYRIDVLFLCFTL